MKNYLKLIKNYKIVFLLKALGAEFKRKIWREGIKNSYSQDYEDLIIEKILNKKVKKYLEIGAYHPTRLSNIYRFYKNGWRGTVIEPNPEVKKLFQKYRPEDKFLGVGISDKNEKLNYYQFLIPALNTFSKKDADKSIKEGHKMIGVEKIKTENITKVVEKNIDFLSLDTEGFDEVILRSWPWKKCKPKVICVEKSDKNLLALVTSKGYFYEKETKHNLIFSKKTG